ncbi:hypothetical protein A249_33031, partial [Pseudomonas syringae pv. actinidiae ICMP 18804]
SSLARSAAALLGDGLMRSTRAAMRDAVTLAFLVDGVDEDYVTSLRGAGHKTSLFWVDRQRL